MQRSRGMQLIPIGTTRLDIADCLRNTSCQLVQIIVLVMVLISNWVFSVFCVCRVWSPLYIRVFSCRYPLHMCFSCLSYAACLSLRYVSCHYGTCAQDRKVMVSNYPHYFSFQHIGLCCHCSLIFDLRTIDCILLRSATVSHAACTLPLDLSIRAGFA